MREFFLYGEFLPHGERGESFFVRGRWERGKCDGGSGGRWVTQRTLHVGPGCGGKDVGTRNIEHGTGCGGGSGRRFLPQPGAMCNIQ